MTNQNQHESALPGTPSAAENNEHSLVDMVAEQRRQREWVISIIDEGQKRINRYVYQKMLDRLSRISAIRKRHKSLKFFAEFKDLVCFTKQLEAVSHFDGYHAYVAESVSKLARQLQQLKACVESDMPCKLMGCPRCSIDERAQALAEASTYLQEVLRKRPRARFFSLTIATNAWLLPLYKADEFLKRSMFRTISTVLGNIEECSDVLITIEGSLEKEKVYPILKSNCIEQIEGELKERMHQGVWWHLHGVLVTDTRGVGAKYLKQTIEHIIRQNVYGKRVDVEVKPMKVSGLRRKPEQFGFTKWLAYITKMLTGDQFDANTRRAFRYATHDAYASGLLSTGPILYRCYELTRGEEYLDNNRKESKRRIQQVKNASSKELSQLVEHYLSNMNPKQ